MAGTVHAEAHDILAEIEDILVRIVWEISTKSIDFSSLYNMMITKGWRLHIRRAWPTNVEERGVQSELPAVQETGGKLDF